jgi:hypothetical protein
MQDQGRSLASSERPFSLGKQGFAVQGRSLAFVDSQNQTGEHSGEQEGQSLKIRAFPPVSPQTFVRLGA